MAFGRKTKEPANPDSTPQDAAELAEFLRNDYQIRNDPRRTDEDDWGQPKRPLDDKGYDLYLVNKYGQENLGLDTRPYREYGGPTVVDNGSTQVERSNAMALQFTSEPTQVKRPRGTQGRPADETYLDLMPLVEQARDKFLEGDEEFAISFTVASDQEKRVNRALQVCGDLLKEPVIESYDTDPPTVQLDPDTGDPVMEIVPRTVRKDHKQDSKGKQTTYTIWVVDKIKRER